jgi:hypothetical protein
MVDAAPSVRIERRFRGPPASGNGGYVCGVLAERLGQPLEVMLRSPPPLERGLTLEPGAAGAPARLVDGATLVAQASPSELALDVPRPPSLAEATAWSRAYPGFVSHPFPECFTCGPARADGDGLRIFPGASPDGALVAAPWHAHPALADATGRIPVAVVWAALDCAGYFATAHPRTALLGKMTALVPAPLAAGADYVVLGWRLGDEGRKRFAATALFDARGERVGHARQTWIVV